jgi:hypothetical protein
VRHLLVGLDHELAGRTSTVDEQRTALTLFRQMVNCAVPAYIVRETWNILIMTPKELTRPERIKGLLQPDVVIPLNQTVAGPLDLLWLREALAERLRPTTEVGSLAGGLVGSFQSNNQPTSQPANLC